MLNYVILILGLLSVQAQGADMSQLERIKHLFTHLRADRMELLDSFYDPNVMFVDPAGSHQGIESVRAYYLRLYQNVKSIEFQYTDSVSEGNQHVLFWVMKLESPVLNGGKLIEVTGNSHVKFGAKNLVVFHRDTFDMGEFIYERIPILSWIVRYIKTRLNSSATVTGM